MKHVFTFFACIVFSGLFAQETDSLEIAMLKDSLARIQHWELGQFEKAEALHFEARDIRARQAGRSHPVYAASMLELGWLYEDWGRYDYALWHFTEAKNIYESRFGKSNTDYAQSLANLGVMYFLLGDFQQSESLYMESSAIYARELGKMHHLYANSLGSLAFLYQNIGQFQKAEKLHKEGIVIWETLLGKTYRGTLYARNNLANLYMFMNQYEKAESIFIELLAIDQVNADTLQMLQPINDLAYLYTISGQYAKAEPLFKKANLICEKIYGTSHPDYARSLTNLAWFYIYMEQYKQPEIYFLEASVIYERVVGKKCQEYAGTLQGLAQVYQKSSQYDQAEASFFEAGKIWLEVFGNTHPYYLDHLDKLAEFYCESGHCQKAEPIHLKINNIRQINLLNNTAFLSEQEIMQEEKLNRKINDKFIAFAASRAPDSPEFSAALWDNALFYKGMLLENALAFRNAVSHSQDSGLVEKKLNWQHFQRLLAAERGEPLAMQNNIQELEEQAIALEKELIRAVPGFRETLKRFSWKEIQACLGSHDAAIEFIVYRDSAAAGEKYAALLLRPDDTHPVFVPLCEEKQLSRLVQRAGRKDQEFYWAMYRPGQNGAASLYDLLWKPLESLLPAGGKIYYSPTGLLHRLNPDAMQFKKNTPLLKPYHLIRLGSTRQLCQMPEEKKAHREVVLMGGVQYEPDERTIPSSARIEDHTFGTNGRGLFSYTDSTLRGGNWSYLPFTQQEVDTVWHQLQQHGFEVRAYTGNAATEEAFRQTGRNSGLPSPKIIHLATHGYFFPDIKTTNPVRNDASTIFKISDHPLIRSGLILAGGNHAWLTGKPLRENMEDGILTAYEISQMDLSDTELVVLSACETGLGDVAGNEGVYGLQRAFKLAGVRYLIMSLWKVDDRATMELMSSFYTNWLQKKMDIPTAFRTAQLELLAKDPNPFFWAGFVLME